MYKRFEQQVLTTYVVLTLYIYTIDATDLYTYEKNYIKAHDKLDI